VLLICQRGCKRFRWAKRSWKTSRRTADDETTESLRRLDNIRTVGSRRATRAKNKQCLSRQKYLELHTLVSRTLLTCFLLCFVCFRWFGWELWFGRNKFWSEFLYSSIKRQLDCILALFYFQIKLLTNLDRIVLDYSILPSLFLNIQSWN
jgi:hypothetical protein